MAFTPLHANNLTAVCYKRRLNVAKGRITHIAISRALQSCTCGVSSLAYTLGGDVQRYTRAEMAGGWRCMVGRYVRGPMRTRSTRRTSPRKQRTTVCE